MHDQYAQFIKQCGPCCYFTLGPNVMSSRDNYLIQRKHALMTF